MKFLLDTHAFLWFVWNDPALSVSAQRAIAEPNNEILVSVAICWEISIKTSLKKINLGESARTFLPREIINNRFDLLTIAMSHATFVETLPHHHKDPFDRILIAQSLVVTLPIISNETLFDSYGVTRLW